MHHLFVGRPARTMLLSSAGLLLAGCFSGCSLLPSSPATPGVPATAALPDASIAYTLSGQGGLPVVFQSAMGDGKDVWAKVVPEVAKQHRVLVYDRPGYGDSRKTTTPRDPCTIAAQQRALLAQAGLKPPYVLVGHGWAGCTSMYMPSCTRRTWPAWSCSIPRTRSNGTGCRRTRPPTPCS